MIVPCENSPIYPHIVTENNDPSPYTRWHEKWYYKPINKQCSKHRKFTQDVNIYDPKKNTNNKPHQLFQIV